MPPLEPTLITRDLDPNILFPTIRLHSLQQHLSTAAFPIPSIPTSPPVQQPQQQPATTLSPN